MICNKCGCDTLINDGDWLVCPNCGSKQFNIDINPEASITKQIDMLGEEQEEAVPRAVTPAEEPEEEKKKPNKLKETIDFLIPIIAAVIIAALLKTFVFANAVVPTGSMISTINEDDRIIASRLAYKSDGPERYDIIMFKYPDDEDTTFVKRVIGLPGETLEVINGVARITSKNGKTIETDQSFVNPEEVPSGNAGPFYIPEMGEEITTDGSFCYAENGMTVGTTAFLSKYCTKSDSGIYTVSENLYFTLGDNRNNSMDSRHWSNKYVSEDKIMGKVIFKYYPVYQTRR